MRKKKRNWRDNLNLVLYYWCVGHMSETLAYDQIVINGAERHTQQLQQSAFHWKRTSEHSHKSNTQLPCINFVYCCLSA